MKEARYYRSNEGDVECVLCPHNCILKEGRRGTCRVRRNTGGKLMSENYGQVSALHSDPIEKKPLYHYFPGRTILSVGSFGCNLHCKFCQNHEISQSGVRAERASDPVSPGEVVALATRDPGNIGIAYTYNEPTVWIEFMLDVAQGIKDSKLKNVMVTNGYINPGPLHDLTECMDAFSVDLKAFSDSFYRDLTSSSLQPVLDTLRTIRKSGRHLEVTNLVIPNRNDSRDEFTRMTEWIAGELGKDTVLHISRYFPTYKLEEPPTTEKTMLDFYDIARKRLDFVYLGNIRAGKQQNTYCPSCNTLAISRSGYFTEMEGINHNGQCLHCGKEVIPARHMHL